MLRCFFHIKLYFIPHNDWNRFVITYTIYIYSPFLWDITQISNNLCHTPAEQQETNLFSSCHHHHSTIVLLSKYPLDTGCQNRVREKALYLMVLPRWSCWVWDLAWNRDIWLACLCYWDDAWTQLWRWTTAWRSVLNPGGPTVLQTCHPPARSKSQLERDTCYSQSYYRHVGRIWIFHILELVSIIQMTPTCRLN